MSAEFENGDPGTVGRQIPRVVDIGVRIDAGDRAAAAFQCVYAREDNAFPVRGAL